MPELRIHNVDYCAHGIAEPGIVDVVNIAYPTRSQPHLNVLVANTCGAGGASDVLSIDFTYSNGAPPVTDFEPGDPNTFVVLPGQTLLLNPGYDVREVAITSTGRVRWSVMAVW